MCDLHVYDANLPGLSKPRRFVNSSLRCPHRHSGSRPQSPPAPAPPTWLLPARRSRCGQRKKAPGGCDIMGTFYSSGHHRLTLLAEQVSSVSVESVHLQNRGAVSPSDAVTAAPPRPRHKKQIPPARSRPRRPRRKTVPLRGGPAGRPVRGLCGKCPSLAAPGASRPAWHACAVVKDRVKGSFTDVSVAEKTASHGLLGGQQ